MTFLRNFYANVLILIACAGFAAQLHANSDTVQLKLNLTEGEQYAFEGTSATSGHIEMPLVLNALIYQYMGLQQDEMVIQNKWKFDLNDHFTVLVKVVSVDAEGNSTLEYIAKERHMELKGDLPGMGKRDVLLDYTNGKVNVVIMEGEKEIFAQELEKSGFPATTITMTPNGRITKINGLATNELVEMASEMVKNTVLNKEEIIQFIDSCSDYYAYPATPVKVGDKWDQKIALNLPLDEMVTEEEVSCSPFNLEIVSDTTMVDVENNVATFKSNMNISPIEWKLEVTDQQFNFHMDLTSQGESETTVDLATGMPKTFSLNHGMKGQFSTTLPMLGVGQVPPVTIPIELKGTSHFEITRAPQQHADADPSL